VPYGWAAWTRNRLYDLGKIPVHRSNALVVSVGNLTLGGTGKTPCVEYVVQFFQERHQRVAILSRGYGAATGLNDEALVLKDHLPSVPHLQGADRVALAAQAVNEFGSDVLVLDDGFQHRRLHRDLDLVLIDATDPWGCGYLFPRGLLREPAVELRRASVVMLTRCNQVEAKERGRLREAVTRFAPHAPVIESSHRPIELVNADRSKAKLDKLCGRTVIAFGGIGNPMAFRQTLIDLGAKVIGWRTYADHHRYSSEDMEDLQAWADCQPEDCLVVTTEKDLVKLPRSHSWTRQLWALRISLDVEKGESVLHDMLCKVVRIPSRISA
jgi:tetraacyldisaccharide 4'-kinase